jgi:hypothetical protein
MLHDQPSDTVQTNKIRPKDHNVYYSATHWPSNQQLSMHSRHVRPDDKTTPGDWSMDTDIYSDDSYDYTNSPKPSPTDWYDQTAPNINYQSKTSTNYDNITTHYPINQLTISKPNLPTGLDDRIDDSDYEQHDEHQKVNCLDNHKLHDSNSLDMYASLQHTLYMPKPTYPMIFKSAFKKDRTRYQVILT